MLKSKFEGRLKHSVNINKKEPYSDLKLKNYHQHLDEKPQLFSENFNLQSCKRNNNNCCSKMTIKTAPST
jgi:hypothetical protein